MPKVKWAGDLDQGAIDSAETRTGGVYTGPAVPAGVYRFTLQAMKTGESKEGNPKLQMIWKIDGSWKPEHKKFDGAPLFDHMPVTKSSAFRAKNLCAALGISSADFMGKMVADDDGAIIKIGKLKIEKDVTEIFANVKKRKSEDYGDGIELISYLEPAEDDEDSDEDSDGDEDGSDPF